MKAFWKGNMWNERFLEWNKNGTKAFWNAIKMKERTMYGVRKNDAIFHPVLCSC